MDGGDPVGLLGGLGAGGVAVDGDAAVVEQIGEGVGGGAGRVGVAGGGAVLGVVEAGLVGHQRGDGGDVLVRADGVLGGARVGGGVVTQADLGEVALFEGAGGGVGEGAQVRGLFPGAGARGAGGEGGVAAADQDEAVLSGQDDGGVDAVVGAAGGERGDGGGELDGGGGGDGLALSVAEDLPARGHVQDGRAPQRAERRVLEQRGERVGQPRVGGCGRRATARGTGCAAAERGQYGRCAGRRPGGLGVMLATGTVHGGRLRPLRRTLTRVPRAGRRHRDDRDREAGGCGDRRQPPGLLGMARCGVPCLLRGVDRRLCRPDRRTGSRPRGPYRRLPSDLPLSGLRHLGPAPFATTHLRGGHLITRRMC